jgi:hypothetical protein
MKMGPRFRKLAVIAHLSSSVGWLGAVVAFLALAISSQTTADPEVMHAAYLGMASVGWFVLIPASLASTLTGLLLALGTPWGLARHYWILTKFAINMLANIALPLYMQGLGSVTVLLTNPLAINMHVSSPVAHAGVALLGLVVATALSVVKPRGVTRYGSRKQEERRLEAVHRGQHLQHNAISAP